MESTVAAQGGGGDAAGGAAKAGERPRIIWKDEAGAGQLLEVRCERLTFM
jgi:hypothetical protein